MAEVWDENWFGSTKTLDVHIGWLRRKLGDDPADPRCIETVRGVGFRFAAPDEERRAVSLRSRLLLALAYVLLLAIVALGVPLGAQPARPRGRRGEVAGALARPTWSPRTAADLLAPAQRANLRDARATGRRARCAGAC